MTNHVLCRLLLLCTLLHQVALAYDNPHFYRATNLLPEARLSKAGLGSFDFSLGFGTTHTARSAECKSVPLFDLYGFSNMHELGVNVPNKNLALPIDLLLTQLSMLPSRENFASFSIGGRFIIVEGIVSLIQNIACGFFLQAYLPIRHIVIKDTCFKDLSPVDDGCPNVNNPLWQTFLGLFDQILAQYCLHRNNIRETGVGDFTVFLGWTHNYQETDRLDFIDTTIRLGLLTPTGKKRNEDQIFSIPLGYNGHFGFDISFDLAIGALEWLTLGIHAEGLVFAHADRTVRIKTALNQQGIIKLAKGAAKTEEGSLWVIAPFVKADHVVRGLSIILGYSFAKKNRNEIHFPCDSIFDANIANTDATLSGFTMHTINTYIEYDLSNEYNPMLPRIGLFFNSPIMGNRIFNTYMVGATCGFDFVWNF